MSTRVWTWVNNDTACGPCCSRGWCDFSVCCFVLLTPGWERWARGKRMGFSPGAAARHRIRTKGPRILSFSGRWYLSGPFFSLLLFHFWNRTTPRFEIGLHSLSNFRLRRNQDSEPRNTSSRRSRGAGDFLSFFLPWVSKTQPNHWTKRMANARLAT